MKIVDTEGYINNKIIKLEINDKVDYVKSLIEVINMDDYTRYRVDKALKRIKTFNKKIK